MHLTNYHFYPYKNHLCSKPLKGLRGCGVGYRFAFNGQEKDDEIAGEGNINTAEFWEYDTRLARRWNIDPKPTIGVSDFSVLWNNPILYIDPFGDKVEYSNFKSRLATFAARITNRKFNQKFKEFKDDKVNTFKIDYDGKSWEKETKEKYGKATENSNGFVSKESENSFTIHWKKSDLDESGSSKYSALYEELFHVDDALGGKVFGGKNQSNLEFKNGLLYNKPNNDGPSYAEADAWIWQADNDRIKSTFTKKLINNEFIKFKIEENLMQQIKKSSTLSSQQRRNYVRNLLHADFMVKTSIGTHSDGTQYQLNGGEPFLVKGPYNTGN